jgi:phosphate butyryltransferase
MIKSFLEMKKQIKEDRPLVIAVAAAHDEEVIQSITSAYEEKLAKAILVGNQKLIELILNHMNSKIPVEIIHEPDEKVAAQKAVSLIREGRADVLMKGLINSTDFLRAVLKDKQEAGDTRVLSHLAAFEVPGINKVIFGTDGGMNIAPDLEMKRQILINSVEALHKMGLPLPKVAILTANEAINPKMPATIDAAQLMELHEKGELPACLPEGPITMDVALSREAASHKGIASQISGDVDIFLMPNIEAGNLVAKTWTYCAGANMAGIILGASYPIVLTSRAENAEGKLNSLVLACFASRKEL